jgi:predicted HicB family RNase H-like nuclease
MAKGEYTDGKVKVTIRLDPTLVRKAKHLAIERGISLQALVEDQLTFAVSLKGRPKKTTA